MAGLARAFGATLALCALMCAWVVLSAGLIYDFSDLVAAVPSWGGAGRICRRRGCGYTGLAAWLYNWSNLRVVPVGSCCVQQRGSYSVLGLIFRTLILGVAVPPEGSWS